MIKVEIHVPDGLHGEVAMELLYEFINNRDSAVSGVHEYQHSDPEANDAWTVSEICTSNGWHWYIRRSAGGDPFASACVSNDPGPGSPGCRNLDNHHHGRIYFNRDGIGVFDKRSETPGAADLAGERSA